MNFAGGDYTFETTVKATDFVIYKDSSNKYAVKEGWSWKLRKFISKQLNIPCTLSFRRTKYRASDILFTGGKCREKLCPLEVTASLPHSTNKLTVTLEKYDVNIEHDTVFLEKISPEDKGDILEKLKGKSAYAIHNELAADILEDENSNPGSVPTKNALRVMHCKEQISGRNQNAVVSMNNLRFKHFDCIQRIDFYPFATQYSTPAQRAFYQNEFKGNKRSVISIDATGLSLTSPTDLKRYIFLYVICAHGTY